MRQQILHPKWVDAIARTGQSIKWFLYCTGRYTDQGQQDILDQLCGLGGLTTGSSSNIPTGEIKPYETEPNHCKNDKVSLYKLKSNKGILKWTT